jgi:hypothetical protein
VLEHFTQADAIPNGAQHLQQIMYMSSRAWPPGVPESGQGSVLDRIRAVPLIPPGNIAALRDYYRKKSRRRT